MLAYLRAEHSDAILDFLCSRSGPNNGAIRRPGKPPALVRHGDSGGARQGSARHEDKMKGFVLWLVDSGRPARMWATDVHDQPIMHEVIAHLRAHRPELGPSQLIAEPVSSLDELMRQIASVDTVVASRFHNVLCALKAAEHNRAHTNVLR